MTLGKLKYCRVHLSLMLMSLVLIAALAGSSCSSSGGSSSDSASAAGDYTKLGELRLSKYETSVDFTALFIKFGKPIPKAFYDEPYPHPRYRDDCYVESDAGEILVGTVDKPDYRMYLDSATSISAGEVLTLSSSAGSYVDLMRQEIASLINYKAPASQTLDANIPFGLNLNIPGDEFPAFTNIPVSDVEPLIVGKPEILFGASADEQIEWNASDDPNSIIKIYTFFGDVYVDCTVVDDGNFVFPDNVKAALPPDEAEASHILFMEREVTTYAKQDDTLLVIKSNYDATTIANSVSIDPINGSYQKRTRQ